MSFLPPEELPRPHSTSQIAEPAPDHARFLRNPSPPPLSQPTQPQPSPPRPRARSPLPYNTARVLRRLGFVFATLLVLATVAVLATALWLRHDLRASLPQNQGQLDGQLAVAGLSAPVTVTRDPQGVPSIHAVNLDDLLFAQGFITASDRLWQMDILRRHAAGDLAEILGPSLIEHDRRQRFLQIRAAADRAAAALPPDQLHQLQAYARGVNAFIDTHPDTLPFEFHLLHYAPAPWTPRDSILVALAMSEDLSTEFPQKLNREELSAYLPADLLPDLYPVGSWRDRPPTQAPPDLTAPQPEIEQIPLDRSQSLNRPPALPPIPRHESSCPIHRVALGAMGGADGCPKSLGDMGSQDASSSYALPTPQALLALFNALNSNRCDGCRSGSNNWVVAGSHTASGAPLLSNDMHLSLSVPDIWYEASLHVDSRVPQVPIPGPGTGKNPTTANNPSTPLDVEGFTLPGMPFVIAGRNASVAWGFTNSGADVQDLRIEHLRGSGPNTQYERPDGTWAPVQHHTELIRVRGGRDLSLDVLTTTHSLGATSIETPILTPILTPEHPRDHRALSLAWPIYDPSTLTVPLDSIDSAPDAASLVAAFAGFGIVSQNLVYADAHHIGYHMLGRIPIRGPAIQRPRAAQPFVLPDPTPEEDDQDEEKQDESGAPQATLQYPGSPAAISSPSNLGAPHLAFEMWVYRHGRRVPGASIMPRSHRPLGAVPSEPNPLQLPLEPATTYTIGSPISPLPVDALDPTQAWSGYIPYDALPSVVDPPNGILATANSRVAPDIYPYFLANDWADPYRVERIDTLLEARSNLTPADMLRLQTDVHSEFDLLLAQRLAYALDHASPARLARFKTDARRLHQAADLLRDWHGDLTPNSSAAAIVAVTHAELWPMLLVPQIRLQLRAYQRSHPRAHPPSPESLAALYTWHEKNTALEDLLQHTPARWLPPGFASWDDLLATAVEHALQTAHAPSDLARWTYGSIHQVDIAHPLFASHGLISHLLGRPLGAGPYPIGGDSTTIDATGPHFGPSERFTADLAAPSAAFANPAAALANPAAFANLPTGQSGNPASPWYLDQFQPWLHGATFPLPLDHPPATHTLILKPQ